MSRIVQRAAALAVGATLITTLLSASGSGAAAQDMLPAPVQSESAQAVAPEAPAPVSSPVVQDILPEPEAPRATSLAALVAAQPAGEDLSRELNCLAGAIYFESKSESLAGQLAVGRVIVARSKSGRFPNSYCGVVYQRSQFSFVRGSSMPAIPKSSRDWKEAAAIARIAHEGTWKSPVEGALFFHAAYVSPGWRMTRLARIENHVFYR